MPNLHPFLVHFPVALLTAAALFELLYALTDWEEWTRVGWWLQAAGTLAIIGAVTSGLIAAGKTPVPAMAADHFETHEQLAFVCAGAFAALLLWRIAARTRIPGKNKWGFIVLFAGALALLWAGAWYGGELVYSYGVGVVPTP